MDRIQKIHQQDKISYKLYASLSTLSEILDVMGDANVIKVGRIDLHDPLYKILDTLSDDDNLLIAAQAAYAKQALVRVPDDESKLRFFLRHGTALVQGFASLYKVISDQDIAALLSAYTNFKDALDFQQGKKQWYGDVRILKFLRAKELFNSFTTVLEKEIKETAKPQFVGNILVLLFDVVTHSQNENHRKWAYKQMSTLFLDDKRWGDSKKLKKEILGKMLECASLPDQTFSDYAKNILGSLEANATTKTQKGILFSDLPDNLNEIVVKKHYHAEEPSTTLITAAQRSQYLSLNQKLEQLKEKVLQDNYLTKELAAYIPVMASRSLFDPKEKPFDLDQAIITFLNSSNPIFLLLGESGGGKSTYLRFLERKLWQNWSETKPIPLFINLPALRTPFHEAINEALKTLGFTEAECKELKAKYRFLFLLDGYDELKSHRNFYVSNRLQEWKGQVIISCRSQYLLGDQSSYQNFFLPQAISLIETPTLDEAAVTPFTSKQVEAYCRKFIQIHQIPRTWEQYQQDIVSVPDIAEIIETPFLLRIIAEVLPEIADKHRKEHGSSQIQLLRLDIFDAFIKRWFNREAQRLINTGAWTEYSDVKKLFAEFAATLAFEMVNANLVAVDYEEGSTLFRQSESGWSRFFGSDSRLALIRSGIPLRKVGPHSYSFIHKSLLEYFSARAIIPNVTSTNAPTLESKQEEKKFNLNTPIRHTPIVSYEMLNRKLLVEETEIIRFLAEAVSQDKALETYLFAVIERSKSNPGASIAAANAITLLNAAAVSFSNRDFRGICVRGANLSKAIFYRTNLTGADLRNVKMYDINLTEANLSRCQLEGIDFGLYPPQKIWIDKNGKKIFDQ